MAIRLSLLILLCFGMLPRPVCGQGNTPKYSNEFLTLGVGARAFGMGGSMAAHTNDVTAGYWNPAGLTNTGPGSQLMLMHASYFAGIANYDYGAFSTALPDSSRLAISVIRLAIDDIPDTRFLFDASGALSYNNLRYFSAADYAFLLSYARRLPVLGGVQAGGNVKIIYRSVGSFSRAWGFGMDFGLQKTWGHWRIGLNGRDVFGTFNAWSHNPDELRTIFTSTGNVIPVNTLEITLPRLISGGSYEWKLPANFSLLASLDLLTTFDGKRNTLIRTNFASFDPYAGLEAGYKDLVFLRFGASQFQQVSGLRGETHWIYQPAGGIGFRLKELTIDYAMTDFSNNAAALYSHIFSIKVDFYEKAGK
ncbi:MAG: hypothetical protein OEY56_09825 [Cyclobacteriaceae bacterium]|nr:hypothetical protein [Cyclobacteriaceae bacterium]